MSPVSSDVARPGDDRGAVMVLAIFWLVACSLLVTTLLTFTGASLVSVKGLRSSRATQYAATGAMDLAIQNVRYNYNSYYSATGTQTACSPGPGNVVTISDPLTPSLSTSVVVFCLGQKVNEYSPTGQTRQIAFTACATTTIVGGSCTTPLATATVVLDDFSATDQYACSATAGTSTCGTGMTVESWDLF